MRKIYPPPPQKKQKKKVSFHVGNIVFVSLFYFLINYIVILNFGLIFSPRIYEDHVAVIRRRKKSTLLIFTADIRIISTVFLFFLSYIEAPSHFSQFQSYLHSFLSVIIKKKKKKLRFWQMCKIYLKRFTQSPHRRKRIFYSSKIGIYIFCTCIIKSQTITIPRTH